MDKVQEYKDRFSTRTDEQLKDIIAGRFEEYETAAIKAAVQLLHQRQPQAELKLDEIPKASTKQLKEIIANPKKWGERAVEIAKRHLLLRKHKNVATTPPMSDSGKLFSVFLIILAAIGIPLLLILLFFLFMLLSTVS